MIQPVRYILKDGGTIAQVRGEGEEGTQVVARKCIGWAIQYAGNVCEAGVRVVDGGRLVESLK
jgi:hypothetical protein